MRRYDEPDADGTKLSARSGVYGRALGRGSEMLSPLWDLVQWGRFPWRYIVLLIALFLGLCFWLFVRASGGLIGPG